MKLIYLSIIFFSITSSGLAQRAYKNQRSGLNEVSYISNFQPQYINNNSFIISKAKLESLFPPSPIDTNKFDGLKFYFVAINNQIMLLFCKSGWDGSSFNLNVTNRKSSIDGTKYFLMKPNGTIEDYINQDRVNTLKENFELQPNFKAVKGYFIGIQELKNLLIYNNKIEIRIGKKANQYINNNPNLRPISFYYLLLDGKNNESSFIPTGTTYFGRDVTGGHNPPFGINDNESLNVNISELSILGNIKWAPQTRSGGSKPCPPFGCQ